MHADSAIRIFELWKKFRLHRSAALHSWLKCFRSYKPYLHESSNLGWTRFPSWTEFQSTNGCGLVNPGYNPGWGHSHWRQIRVESGLEPPSQIFDSRMGKWWRWTLTNRRTWGLHFKFCALITISDLSRQIFAPSNPNCWVQSIPLSVGCTGVTSRVTRPLPLSPGRYTSVVWHAQPLPIFDLGVEGVGWVARASYTWASSATQTHTVCFSNLNFWNGKLRITSSALGF